ncbi:hypothetical protein [Campylobacter concisus]|uniref:DUF4390 domain-containing protein n=1 Tax=Campylobacter concisus TaxID=199 RepID=A0A9E1B8X0_9BACT|nr:hypothetical protein [Campylobacter concisus]MBS5830162.1 hypothetical protein [Campylobacter concisus]
MKKIILFICIFLSSISASENAPFEAKLLLEIKNISYPINLDDAYVKIISKVDDLVINKFSPKELFKNEGYRPRLQAIWQVTVDNRVFNVTLEGGAYYGEYFIHEELSKNKGEFDLEKYKDLKSFTKKYGKDAVSVKLSKGEEKIFKIHSYDFPSNGAVKTTISTNYGDFDIDVDNLPFDAPWAIDIVPKDED